MKKGILRFSMAFAGAAIAAQVGTVSLAAEPHWDRNGRIERLDDRYHHAPGAEGFVVVRPPVGLLVTSLPPYYTTVWIGGPL